MTTIPWTVYDVTIPLDKWIFDTFTASKLGHLNSLQDLIESRLHSGFTMYVNLTMCGKCTFTSIYQQSEVYHGREAVACADCMHLLC